ncbi:hypothetical protein [Coraliomargarita sinensis]|uniref:hypothetical protein n=1 Tax=Coraliomargarita sinensis TaxID=2174842 RepID=UPI001304DC9F|nr:hypothetical protein [Coraliomargarita sinensis]
MFVAGAVLTLNFTGRDNAPAFEEQTKATQDSVDAESGDANKASVQAALKSSESALEKTAAHGADCAHCQAAAEKPTAADAVKAAAQLTTQPRFDSIFKNIAKEQPTYTRSDFDFLAGSQVGDAVAFELAGRQFSGEVALVREGKKTKAYSMEFPEGTFTVTTNKVGEFQAFFMFRGDSRAVEISEIDSELGRIGHEVQVVDGQVSTPEGDGTLITTQIKLSDVMCAPRDAVYGKKSLPGARVSGLASPFEPKASSTLNEPVGAVPLTENPGTGHVLYLDFDGETVTDDFWNISTAQEVMAVGPAPRNNDNAWVTNVFNRVVEDFAPFNITVTTERDVFDAADPEQRLQVIITPDDLVSQAFGFNSSGGWAYTNSYATNLTRIVWVYNLSEYTCATTISHEAGHAFGLSHDYALGDSDEYYPGHNGSYTPGWGTIMGAPFQDFLLDEVDQWSRGEFEDAVNEEDDIQIIARTANGFGFKEDDFAGVFTGGAGLDVGFLSSTGENQVGASGLISRQSDVDVFRFSVAFSGELSITVNPYDVESNDTDPGSDTKGANLAVDTRLLDSTGAEIAVGVDAGSVSLASLVEADVDAGIYYIEVTGGGRGDDPFTGFSDYASLGQYQIVGELPTQPLDVFGSDKQDQPVLNGDESTSFTNGTNYGYSYPNNAPITRTFRLENTGSDDLTNVSLSLSTGIDFQIVSAPPTVIPAGTSVWMQIAYDPLQAGVNGIDADTVTIDYETIEPISFSFAVSGYSTKSAEKDNYEDNNAAKYATDLNSVKDTWLSDYKGPGFFLSDRSDFYTFNVNNDELVSVEVSYDSTEGPITFELRNGHNVVLGSTTAEDGLIRFRVPLNYTAQHKKFYIKVSTLGDSSVRNAYDLRWNAISFEAGDDDFYEDNDTRETAFDLTGAFSPRLSEYLGSGISSDEDWYKIDIPADPFIRMLHVRAEFVNAEGNIDIQLIPENDIIDDFFFGNIFFDEIFFDEFLNELFLDGFLYNFFGLYGLAGADEDYEVITYSRVIDLDDLPINYSPADADAVNGVEPGTYYIRVTGDLAGNEYDLVVEPRRDDRYEIVDEADGVENDLFDNAFDLGDSIVGRRLSQIDGIGVLAGYADNATEAEFAMQADADWFRFSVPSSTPVEQLVFNYSSIGAGLVIFRLFDENGNLLRQSTQTSGNVTTLFFYGDVTLVRPTGNVFYIQAVPWLDNDFLAAYDFRVDVLSEPPNIEAAVDDNYEENDNFTEAFDISNNANFWLTAVDGYGVQLDPDWYEITVPDNIAELEIRTAFDGAEGNMDLTLSRKDGPVLFRSTTPPPDPDDDEEDAEPVVVDSRSIVWPNPDPGKYAVTVTGDRRGNLYNLFWGYTLGEDKYEENDILADAFDLTGHEKQLLTKLDGPGVQKDEDWYRITASANTAELQVINTFSHDEGDIDLELYNSAGFLIARSTSVTDNEDITLLNPASGDYFIRIYYGNRSNEYDLWWGAFTQQELDTINEDAYEENDSLQSVSAESDPTFPSHTPLESIDGLATQTDDDWYKIQLSDINSGFLVECNFIHAEGDIDVEVVDSEGAVLIRSESTTDDELIDYNASLPGGTYFIRVYGANLGNTYDLFWIDKREDDYEQNDSFGTAFDITDLQQTRLSETAVPTQGDDDWYSFTVEEANSVLVLELSHTNATGAISFELYDSNENLLADDLTTDDLKYLQYELTTAGDYYVRVFGDDNYNVYDLFWNALPEDAFEENDVLDDAFDISADEGVGLEGVVFDDDWFAIDPAYGVVAVELNLDFSHAFGNTNVNVYNQFGELIAFAASLNDGENLTFEVNPFDGVTYIEVFGADGNYGNPYTLTWTSITRDLNEDNDTKATATDLTGQDGIPLSENGGYDTSTDEDWFFFVPSGSNLNVYCRFDHAEGDIDIELHDENGFIERSISDTDDETISTTVTPGETYYIRVYGQTAGNPYDLVWTSYDSDDSFEENDSAAAAGDLVSLEYERQEDLVQLDDDWYEIEVQAGEDLLIAQIFPVSRVDGMVLGLYDDSEVLVDSVAVADGESRLESESLTDGTYYLRVSGANLGGNYSLIWSSGSEDNYEENDELAEAYDFSANPATQLSTIDGSGAQYDEDWYRVSIPTDNSALFAQLDFLHDEGDLTLALYDENETLLDFSIGTVDVESFTTAGLDAGDYYLLVLGPNSGTMYDLIWSTYTEDNYEDNDSFDETYDLGSSVVGDLSAIDGLGVRGNDDDYYELYVPVGYVRLDVTCSFAHADGDIELQAFDGDEEILDASNTATDDESLSVPVDPTGDTIYIKVTGALATGAEYDLSWSFDKVDLYEDNDSTGTAIDITAFEDTDDDEVVTRLSDLSGFATQGDSDFYLVTLPVNSRTLNVNVFFDHSLGDIDVNVYDSVPAMIGSASSTTDNEFLSVPVDLAGGDYYIEVTGTDSENYYDLVWSVDIDDPYEENDDNTQTYDLSASSGVRLSALMELGAQYDEDWFILSTPAEDISLNVLIDEFSVVDGDINLEVYDASDNLLASSVDGNTSEEITLPVDPAGETFKIRVFGDGNGNTYDLVWTSSTEDVYEENDVVDEFYDLTGEEGVWISTDTGFATQSDDDWYQIIVSSGATELTIDCDFTHADGDIDLELYRLDPTPEDEKTLPGVDQRKPTLVDRALSTDDDEQIIYDTTGAPGIYFIRVYFGNGGNRYDLRWVDEDGLGPVVDPVGDEDFLVEEWTFGDKDNFLLDARLLAPMANEDGDAFENWAEYAFDLNIGVADTVVVDNSRQEIDGKTYFTISYIRNAEAVTRGYQFFVEECGQLSFNGDMAVLQEIEPLENGLERVTYRSSRDMEEAPHCFFRIRVEAPEKAY